MAPLSPSAHGKTFLASLVLVLFAGALIWQGSDDAEDPPGPVDLTVEHRGSFGLTLRIGRASPTSFIDIGNDGAGEIRITLPEHWVRREVRFVPFDDVTVEPPALGYARWTLPPGSLVSFRTQSTWSSLIIRNPSKLPFKITLTTVDLENETSETEVILVKDRPLVLP